MALDATLAEKHDRQHLRMRKRVTAEEGRLSEDLGIVVAVGGEQRAQQLALAARIAFVETLERVRRTVECRPIFARLGHMQCRDKPTPEVAGAGIAAKRLPRFLRLVRKLAQRGPAPGEARRVRAVARGVAKQGR